jgi:hypothetical protein
VTFVHIARAGAFSALDEPPSIGALTGGPAEKHNPVVRTQLNLPEALPAPADEVERWPFPAEAS